jgi:hypothetical protein
MGEQMSSGDRGWGKKKHHHHHHHYCKEFCVLRTGMQIQEHLL